MIRPLLAGVGRWIESLVSPPPSVLAGVAAEAEAAADREVDDLIASFDELFPVRIGTVAVAGVADRNQLRGGERRPPRRPPRSAPASSGAAWTDSPRQTTSFRNRAVPSDAPDGTNDTDGITNVSNRRYTRLHHDPQI